MSKLREAIRQRRQLNSPCPCARIAAKAVQTLRIRTKDKSWVLPWSHFIAAAHEDDGEAEKLMLSFTGHEVLLEGVGLGLLLPSIAACCVKSLSERPATSHAQIEFAETVVTRLRVRVANSNAQSGYASSIKTESS